MHERSETVQRQDGRWINIYGRGTPNHGKQIPGTPVYDTMEEAVKAAKDRSDNYGRGVAPGDEKVMDFIESEKNSVGGRSIKEKKPAEKPKSQDYGDWLYEIFKKLTPSGSAPKEGMLGAPQLRGGSNIFLGRRG